jgi:hypothetical protein
MFDGSYQRSPPGIQCHYLGRGFILYVFPGRAFLGNYAVGPCGHGDSFIGNFSRVSMSILPFVILGLTFAGVGVGLFLAGKADKKNKAKGSSPEAYRHFVTFGFFPIDKE